MSGNLIAGLEPCVVQSRTRAVTHHCFSIICPPPLFTYLFIFFQVREILLLAGCWPGSGILEASWCWWEWPPPVLIQVVFLHPGCTPVSVVGPHRCFPPACGLCAAEGWRRQLLSRRFSQHGELRAATFPAWPCCRVFPPAAAPSHSPEALRLSLPH